MAVKNKLNQFFMFFVFILPFVLAYIFIFNLSMETALDRADYLRLMDPNWESRVEPLLPLISYIFDFIVSEKNYKLILIQFSFLFLFLLSIYKYFKPIETSSLAKVIFLFLLCLTVFSNQFGVQLRIGYATILFIFIIVFFRRPYIFFIVPLLMHYGTIFSILFYMFFSIFNIDSRRKFLICSFFSLSFLTVFFMYVEVFFELIGVSRYYYNYLNEEESFGRALPYSTIFYLIVCCYLLLFVKKNGCKLYWFSLSGLWLVYVGFILDFYLAFKMLTPISLYALFYALKCIPDEKNKYVYLIGAYMFSPIAFLYFALQVDIMQGLIR
ncbi:EpsG family protein [Acinetobacter indicus]|uniref:EpsG family protein n=1 Tax=Acinetobacter indicus TaxID=756892 RepID=UPI000CEC5A39|nr:EpsG family protein [Acinetobacter indicus]